MPGIYKSERGRKHFRKLYDSHLAKLDVAIDEQYVETRFGSTHVLSCGPADGQPVLVLHGGNSTTFETLRLYTPLADTYRLIAPDTIGHPGKSAETRLCESDLSYGQWAEDVVGALELAPLPFLGTSYGGGITLKTAAHAPHLISKAILVVSAGIAQYSAFHFMRTILWPTMAYQWFGGKKRLLRLVQEITPQASPDSITEVQASFDHLRLARLPSLLQAEQLAQFSAPTCVLAAQHDAFFPAQRVLERSQQLFRNLQVAEVIEEAYHFLGPAAANKVVESCRSFLADESGPSH